MSAEQLDAARLYLRAGLSVIPIRADGSKAPALKAGQVEQYRERFATPEELNEWFTPARAVGLAVVCGKGSGNLAVLDFESQTAWETWGARITEMGFDGLIHSFPLVKTPKGGRHLYCRIREGWVAGGKLAMRGPKETLIEVRAQGHYVLAPGCPLACHELLKPYLFERKGWIGASLILETDTISLDDYTTLCAVARECNEWIAPERHRTPAPVPSDIKGTRPGDEFNHWATWPEVLEPHGWKVDRTSGDVTYWTRPDKSRGTSATTGKCRSELGGDLLYVFTSHGDPLEMDTAYSKFAAFAVLEHRGDYRAAAVALHEKGYGRSDPKPIFFPEPPDPHPDEADDVAGVVDLIRAGAEVTWLWEHWFQIGVLNAIAAEGGTGKTRLMADLIRRARHRLDWPDGTPIEITHGNTIALWVLADNHHDEIVTLCKAFDIVDCVKINAPKADPYAGVTLEGATDFAELEGRIKKTRPIFVIVDTVGNATDLNLSKQEDAKKFYQPLQLIARRQRVTIVPMTHLNAGGKVLGRRALEKVRVCIRMNSENVKDHTKPRRLEVIKSNSKTPAPLGVVMGDSGNEYNDSPPPAPGELESEPKPLVGDRCLKWLEELIRAKPHRLSKLLEMGERHGFASADLYRAKKGLKVESIKMEGTTWWRFTPDA